MACSVTLSGITYDCADLGIGGITKLSIAAKSEVDTVIAGSSLVINEDTRVVSTAGVVANVADYTFNLNTDSLLSTK